MNRILYKLKNAILFLAVYIVIFFITMFINENLAAVMLAGIVIGVPIYLGYLLLETVKYFMNKKNTNVISSQQAPLQTRRRNRNKQVPKRNSDSSVQTNHVSQKVQAHESRQATTPIGKNSVKPVNDETTLPKETPKQAVVETNVHPIKMARRTDKPTVHHLRRKLKDFVVIDIETTGLQRDAKIIQLSSVKYKKDELVDTFNRYINPGIPVPADVSAITGITDQLLQDAPTFDEVVSDFVDFVGDLPWIGHNINGFDIPKLINNGLPLTEVSTIDTLRLARKKLTNLSHHSLEILKHYYGIKNKSHNALEDCKTNAIVYQRLRDDILEQVEADYSDIVQTLAGLNFAISGSFSGYSRADVKEIIMSHGGKVKSTVTKDTNYLVDGTQTSDKLTDGVHSGKKLKAQKYGIKMIGITELKEMANG